MESISGGSQGIELAALLALIAVWAFALRRPLSRLRAGAPIAFQAVLASALGLVAAIVVLALAGDLIPDESEVIARTLLFAGLAFGGIVAVARELIEGG